MLIFFLFSYKTFMTRISGLTSYLVNLDFFFFFFISFFLLYVFFSFNPVSFFFFFSFFMHLTADCRVQSTAKRPMTFVFFCFFSF